MCILNYNNQMFFRNLHPIPLAPFTLAFHLLAGISERAIHVLELSSWILKEIFNLLYIFMNIQIINLDSPNKETI